MDEVMRQELPELDVLNEHYQKDFDFSEFRHDCNSDHHYQLLDSMLSESPPKPESQQIIMPQYCNESDGWAEIFAAPVMASVNSSSMADQSQKNNQLPSTFNNNAAADYSPNIYHYPNHSEYSCNFTSSEIALDQWSGMAAEMEKSVWVIKTRSNDEKSLDDGYKWRKYGKKTLKRSPHARNYYKCAEKGCPVKKYVERDASDASVVMSTYHRKHNHVCPSLINNTTFFNLQPPS